MLYNLLYPFSEDLSVLNVFGYLTFRTGGGMLTAMLISFAVGPSFIRWLKARQPHGQPIREEGPKQHLITKAGTPTMGGLLILSCAVLSTLLWANLANQWVWIVLLVAVGFGIIGGWDDYSKLRKRHNKGLSSRGKFLSQLLLSAVAVSLIMEASKSDQTTMLSIPFFKDWLLDLGWFYVPFAVMVIVGTSNAVNLTDGLDGLAIVPAMIAAACFAIIAYLTGNAIFSQYLFIPFVPGTGELAVFCGALIGAGLGFLWFNAPPASVFMGDTGSLAMGGSLGTISVITKHELVLLIIGGLFVMETVSVMVQVASFKLTGKRVFRMAPLHHHFEQKGWSEPTIVIRFWIIATILALIGLSTLKLR